jgi:hypothetical protein
MTASEIAVVDNDLRDILSKTGLGWVVVQVDQTIREGQSAESQTRIFSDEDDNAQQSIFPSAAGKRRAGKTAVMMRREPWSATDKLLFLINGVRQAIVRAADVENEQLRLLQKAGPVKAVAFEPDADAEISRRWDMTGIQSDGIKILADILDKLEHEVRG